MKCTLPLTSLRIQHKDNTCDDGFTLIELLVAISIIAVLAGLLLVNFVGIRERAADAQKKSDLNEVKKALRLYYNDNQRYPYPAAVTGDTFDDGDTVYMEELPNFDYSYYSDYSVDPRIARQNFILHTELDREGDPAAAASVDRCDPESKSFYTDNGGPTPDGDDFYVCND